jgi:hypothetical protein
MTPYYGYLTLENGKLLRWVRFACNAEEAKRIVIAQHVHVRECWLDSQHIMEQQ